MITGVSSWFWEELESQNPRGIKFDVNFGGDITPRLLNYPVLNDNTNALTIGNYNMSVEKTSVTSFSYKQTGSIRFGLTHPQSGTEWLLLSSAYVGNISQTADRWNLGIYDRRNDMYSKQLGSALIPLDFTTSEWNISDMIWSIVTSYAGFDSTASTSNVDLDYADFQILRSTTSGYLFQGYFQGENLTTVLSKIEEYAFCKFYSEGNRLSVKKLSQSSGSTYSFDSSNIFEIESTLKTDNLVNRADILFGYSIANNPRFAPNPQIMQGMTYNTDSRTLIYNTGSQAYIMSMSGSPLGSFAFPNARVGIGYDPSSRGIWSCYPTSGTSFFDYRDITSGTLIASITNPIIPTSSLLGGIEGAVVTMAYNIASDNIIAMSEALQSASPGTPIFWYFYTLTKSATFTMSRFIYSVPLGVGSSAPIGANYAITCEYGNIWAMENWPITTTSRMTSIKSSAITNIAGSGGALIIEKTMSLVEGDFAVSRGIAYDNYRNLLLINNDLSVLPQWGFSSGTPIGSSYVFEMTKAFATIKFSVNSITLSNTASVSSYGTFKKTIQDTALWGTTSATALFIASNTLVNNYKPKNEVKLTTGFHGMKLTIPDIITVQNNLDYPVATNFRITQRQQDMGKGKFIITGEEII